MTDIGVPEGRITVEVDTAELAKLRLRPGDILLLRYPETASDTEARLTSDAVRYFLTNMGIENPVLAIPKNLALAVLEPN